VEALRARVGDAVRSEDYYRQARRAVYMAQILPKRGVQHLHAWRSDGVICVWLVKHLAGLCISVGVEETPALGRAALGRLLPDFDLVSISDKKLAAESGISAGDDLRLLNPVTHKVMQVGPLRIKRKLRGAPPPRTALERDWVEKIHRNLHA
jgi:hypothetical protein